MTSRHLAGGTITLATLGWIPCPRDTLLCALCIVAASWITLGEVGDTVDDAIAEACTASTGSGARCFRLYTPVEAASWLSANDICLTRGLHLATVQDSQAQEALVNLSGLFQYGTKHAWIAGRRSTDDTWRATDSTLSYAIPDDTGRYCSQLVRRDPDMTFDLMAAPCIYTGFTDASSLCQYQQTSGRCEGGWFPLDDQCFKVVTRERGSWYAGRADCRSAGPPGVEGDLAYSHFTDPRLFQELPLETPHTLWVGVYRNPWVWPTADATEMEISEFFWVPGQGTSSSLSDCLYANLRDGSSWGGRSCSDSLDFVICEQVKPIETSAAPHSSQSPPRASLATDLSNQRTTATSSVAYDNVTVTVKTDLVLQENQILIGCLAGGMGVLSVVVMILVIMLRRRKKGSNSKPPSAMDGSPYAVTTFATSPDVADNGQGLPNGDGARWNHVTPPSSGYLQIGRDSHVVSRPSSAVVSPYAVATGAEIACREGSDGVQRYGNNRLIRLWAAFWRTTEGNTAHAPPGPQTRDSGDDDDDGHPYLEPSPSVARPKIGDGATTSGTSGRIPSARSPQRRSMSPHACYLTTSADVYLTTSAA